MVRLGGTRSTAAERVNAFIREQMEASNGDYDDDADDNAGGYNSVDDAFDGNSANPSSHGGAGAQDIPAYGQGQSGRFTTASGLEGDGASDSPIPIAIISAITWIQDTYNDLMAIIQRDILPRLDSSPILGDPVMSNVTYIVLLFVFQNRFSTEALLLITSFQYNINPIYAVLGVCMYIYSRPRQVPRQYVKLSKRDIDRNVRNILEISNVSSDSTSATSIANTVCNDAIYDHVFIGYNIGTLYCAALLAKCGHKCIVIPTKSGHQKQVNINASTIISVFIYHTRIIFFRNSDLEFLILIHYIYILY